MAEFRKLFYALGFAAMLAGVSTTASAQAINCSRAAGSVPSIIRAESFADLVGDYVLDCVGGTPTVAGQIVPPVNITVTLSTNITSKILATGGSVGAAGNFTEALLIIDEPNVTPRQARPLLACGSTAAPVNNAGEGICQIISPGSANGVNTYDGTGNTYGVNTCDATAGRPGANSFGCGRPNVFQGRQGLAQNSGNTNIMLFNGIPFDPPGQPPSPLPDGATALQGHRILRITNIRANSPQVAGGFLLAEVTMHVNITGVAGISITEPSQRVASVNIGIQNPTLSNDPGPGLTTFVQCVPEFVSTNTPNGGRRPIIRFREGFPSSFKTKGVEFMLQNGQTTNIFRYSSVNASTNIPSTTSQNVPGVNYNTESGFVAISAVPGTNPPAGIGSGIASTANGAFPTTNGMNVSGIATQGTRIAVTFSNLPIGITVTVPNVVPLVQAGTTTQTGLAIRTQFVSARGDGPLNPYSGTNSVVEGDMAVYEVLYADPSVLEDLAITVLLENPANRLSSDLPEVNKTAQVAGGFAPFILAADDQNVWGRAQRAGQTSSDANLANPAVVSRDIFGTNYLPVPRFRTQSTPVDFFRVVKCACNLLFPFVSNAASTNGNFDTGIALANTSLTPGQSANPATRFGFAPTAQDGPVQFWYYPANATDPPVATQCTNTAATGVCPGTTNVKGGETLLYVLSSGSARWGLKGAPGFTGYMIAQASFQYCHAFAYISPQGATPLTNGMSVGYLALQLDNNVNATNGLPARTPLASESLAH